MKRYFKIIIVLYKTAVMRDMEYRTSFVSMLVANLSWTNFTLFSILLLNRNIPRFGGWSENELLILTGCWMLINYLMFSFVYGNFRRLMRDIFDGDLDFFLLKPIDSQFLVTTQRFAIGATGSLIEGIVLIAFVAVRGGLELTIINLSAFLILILSGAVLYYSFYMIIAAMTVLNPLADNLVYLVSNIAYVSKYPDKALPAFFSTVFTTIVPMMLMTLLPAQALLGKLSLPVFFYGILVALVFFLGSRRLWFWSLKHYSSASS